uniref:Uncharacterized protein n=1 Tax=Anopheles farauti TaxID=69004 RepID=A0A182QUY8_9DIPT
MGTGSLILLLLIDAIEFTTKTVVRSTHRRRCCCVRLSHTTVSKPVNFAPTGSDQCCAVGCGCGATTNATNSSGSGTVESDASVSSEESDSEMLLSYGVQSIEDSASSTSGGFRWARDCGLLILLEWVFVQLYGRLYRLF